MQKHKKLLHIWIISIFFVSITGITLAQNQPTTDIQSAIKTHILKYANAWNKLKASITKIAQQNISNVAKQAVADKAAKQAVADKAAKQAAADKAAKQAAADKAAKQAAVDKAAQLAQQQADALAAQQAAANAINTTSRAS